MRIIGIDPGYGLIGYGVIDYINYSQFHVAAYGAIATDKDMIFEDRLKQIYDEMKYIMDRTKPDVMAIEKLYFSQNVTTGIAVAEARGVILLTAAQQGISVHEYTPNEIKLGVTGYGRAEKKQVMELTRQLLKLEKVPKPDDTADALAVAICHAHTSGSALGKLYEMYGK